MTTVPSSRAFFQLVDESIDAIVIIDALCRIRYVNGALERLVGYGDKELVGESLNGLLPEKVARQHDGYVQRYLERFHQSALLGQVRDMQVRHRTGELIPVQLKALDLGLDTGERLFGAVMVDQRAHCTGAPDQEPAVPIAHTQRQLRQLQVFKDEHAEIMEQIARDAPLENVLAAIVRMLEAYDPRFICSILLFDQNTCRLRHGAAPSLSDAYNQAIDGAKIGPRAGSCGTAAFEKCLVVAADIATDPLWEDYRELAIAHGLRACWSVPIFSADNSILGTFAIYSLSPGKPQPEELALHQSCCHIASVAIERHRATQALRDSEERFRQQASLLDNTQDAIVVRNMQGIITFWNKGAERMFGWSRTDMLGRSIKDLLYETEERDRFDVTTESLLQHGDCTFERKVRDRHGKCLYVDVRKSVVRDTEGEPQAVLVTLTNITARKLAEEEIYHLAFYDQLTQLPNRRLLNDRIQRALAVHGRSKQKGAALLIDLDGFKTVNDTHGHDAGDLLLKEVARRLSACVRERDTVSRLGGDEFVVILEELGADYPAAAARAEAVAQKIAAALSHPYLLGGHEHNCTASIGISLFAAHDSTPEALLKEADMAMYRAKAEGRNAIRLFDPQMQAGLARRSALQTDLRAALNRDELELYFQPQVDHRGATRSAEALLRWRHPVNGFISPAEFIPLAEDTGLMVPLGNWVIRQACATLASWARDAAMQDMQLAVNVSIFQFRRPDFVDYLLTALDATGADPSKLKLEITESVFADDMQDTVAKMMALKAKGISFSLDDFGTGYSSLSYLKRLPLDQLKIDQSFIRDILVDPNDATIACTIIALAHTLGLEVIAEGVETAAQRDLLLQHHCRAYQGYLFSKPLPEQQLRDYMLGQCTATDRTVATAS